MIHFKLALLLIFVGSFAKAQQLTPQTLCAAGASISNENVVLEYTLGGLLVNSVTTTTSIYTQDFLQPDAGTTTDPIYINDVTLSSGSGMDNAGTTFIAGNAMIEFTLGETVSATINDGSNMLTQGILQPYRLYKWTGLVNTSWPHTGNWESGLVPSQSDEALIPEACPNYPIIASGVFAKCSKLTVKPTASVTVDTGGNLRIYK